MSLYAIQMADGSVAIMQPIGDVTPEECLAKWHPDEQAKVVSHQPIEAASIPGDRTFRDAWVLDGDAIIHDMDKARNIKRDMLRFERAPELIALDGEYLKALEVGDKAALEAVAAKKQKLRDVTADPAIDAATTVDDLKAVTLSKVRK